MKRKLIIMGAAGRDFHNFNVLYKDDPNYDVVAFTANQIPDIEGRVYPSALAGRLYPNGIPITHEDELPELIQSQGIDDVVFAYSDISHEYVMHRASLVNAAGANFVLAGRRQTMLSSSKPVVAICAVRTGAGKSQTTRRVVEVLKVMGKRPVVVRHPMPYGDLVAQRLQRFAAYEDLKRHRCTIEEMEEYEPHLAAGTIVYAGVDYEAILREAEAEADVIVWDGGNNDTSFYKPDVQIVVVDPHRPGHELTYHPGEINVRCADAVVINKQATSRLEHIESVRRNVLTINPKAIIIDAASPLYADNAESVQGKRVLVIEDGPTLTHGEM